MVDRQLNNSDRDRDNRAGAVVTDLDGTLIEGNSLKWILKAGLKRMLRRGRIPSVLTVLTLGGLAWSKLVSHETMKYGVLRLFGDDPRLMEEMRRLGMERRNTKVEGILHKAEEEGQRVLLATAASESYVRQLWTGEFIASPFGGPDLRGGRKVEAVKAWLNQNNLRLEAFLTDHYHDLPLARYASEQGAKVYLVNPTEKSLLRFKEAGIKYILI